MRKKKKKIIKKIQSITKRIWKKICTITKKIWEKYKKYFWFLIFSGIGTLADIGIMILLGNILKKHTVEIAFWSIIFNVESITKASSFCFHNVYAISNAISYIVGVGISFILSAKFAFKIKKEDMRKCTIDTIAVHISGFAAQELLIFILMNMGKDKVYAKMLAVTINGILMLLSNIIIVFRDRNNDKKKKLSNILRRKKKQKVSDGSGNFVKINRIPFFILKDLFSFV